MVNGSLDDLKFAFNRVGWFIPPYLSLGYLRMLQHLIDSGTSPDPRTLEALLARAYSPKNLAAMVRTRYAETPYVQDYREIIGEAVEAHFLGLRHAAVAALLPAVEGIGLRLAASRSLAIRSSDSTKAMFAKLAEDCKAEAVREGIGMVDEIVSMFDSFIDFTGDFLYVKSTAYPLDDYTNRHGVLHGVYADKDYGDPINFYKTIGCIDFLCMVSAFRAQISWFAPDSTPESLQLSAYYEACILLGGIRPS